MTTAIPVISLDDLHEIARSFAFLVFFCFVLSFCCAWSVKQFFIILKDIFFHSRWYQARLKRLGLHVVYVNGSRYVRRVENYHG